MSESTETDSNTPPILAELSIEQIARVCHEAHRAYCSVADDPSQPSQLSWDNAPDWQRASVIEGVRTALDNPGTTPAEMHAPWMFKQECDGWTWGPVKDAEAKKHPCMVPYAQLPPAQMFKDVLFLAIVRALSAPLVL